MGFTSNYTVQWLPVSVAGSISADEQTLAQIRLEDSESYGNLSTEEHDTTTATNDSDDEELSLSDDEASTKQEIRIMSVPSGTAESSGVDEEEAKITTEFVGVVRHVTTNLVLEIKSSG